MPAQVQPKKLKKSAKSTHNLLAGKPPKKKTAKRKTSRTKAGFSRKDMTEAESSQGARPLPAINSSLPSGVVTNINLKEI